MSEKYDIVVAGGGHNGMVAACYLAKAGMKVCVVEKNDMLGGGVMTRTFGPNKDFRYDVCSLAHTMIQPNPLILNDELGLKSKYGLKYAHPDKMTSIFYDDGRTLDFHTDFEKTAASIAKFSAKDAEAYTRFNKTVFQNLDLLVMGMYNPSPTGGHQAMMMDQSPEGQELMRVMSMSAWDMISEYFESDYVKIAMARYASEVMFNPFDNATGFGFYATIPLMHKYGTGIPIGGSGVLVDKLAECFKDLGGVAKVNSPIKEFKISGGKAVGVVLESGEEILASKACISNLHVKQVFPKMVPGASLPSYFVERAQKVKFSAYSPFNMNLALHESPKYKASPNLTDFFWVEKAHQSLEEFEKGFWDLDHGIPNTGFVAWVTPDTVDSTRTPPGKHNLNMYALNTYNLKDGGAKNWDKIGKEVAYRYLEDIRAVTTNMGDDNIIDFVWYTPLDIERHNNAMIQGDLQHFGLYNWQLGGNRPVPGYGQYRSPVDQLWMTGASTHPGGGVTAASGRSVARLVMEEFNIDFDKVIGA